MPSGDLVAGFAQPPDSARPRVYWFWLGGSISREGITADLEAMKLGLTQVSETNPKVRGVDPREFVDGRLLREIEASGFVKRLYGEEK